MLDDGSLMHSPSNRQGFESQGSVENHCFSCSLCNEYLVFVERKQKYWRNAAKNSVDLKFLSRMIG